MEPILFNNELEFDKLIELRLDYYHYESLLKIGRLEIVGPSLETFLEAKKIQKIIYGAKISGIPMGHRIIFENVQVKSMLLNDLADYCDWEYSISNLFSMTKRV